MSGLAQVFHDGPGLAGGEVAALIEGNAALRQFCVERTTTVVPGGETTDGLFGIGIGKIKADQGTTDVSNGFYNRKQRLKAIIIIAKKREFLVLSTISAHFQ